MKFRGLIDYLRARSSAPLVLVSFVFLWQSFRAAASLAPVEPRAPDRGVAAIRQAAARIIKPGDHVLVSTRDWLVLQSLEQSGASVYPYDPSTEAAWDESLASLLQDYCRQDTEQGDVVSYWIQSAGNGDTPVRLGQAARALNFLFTFQAVLPYQGDDAFAIDKVLRLHPNNSRVLRFCEVKDLVRTGPVVAIVPAEEFSPWIGSVVTGSTTWLASGPQRTMAESDFAVKDMPQMITFDVYWLGQVPLVPTWTFSNQDRAAYERAVQVGKAQDSVLLVDRSAQLGVTAQSYVRECNSAGSPLESKLLRQMCFK